MSAIFVDDTLIDFPGIYKIALGVFIFELLNKEYYVDFLGHFGNLDDSSQAKLSQLFKLHIVLNDDDSKRKKWQKLRAFERTSNNFVVYTRHIVYPQYYCILGVISPKAHERMRENQSLLTSLIKKAEMFHGMRETELLNKAHISSESELVKSLLTDLTPKS